MELRHVTIHGHEVGYRLAGRGPVILLIHGMAGGSRTWLEVMRLLACDYTVIAPDLLGHGASAKPMGDYSLGAHASGLRDLLVGALGVWAPSRCSIASTCFHPGFEVMVESPDRARLVQTCGRGGKG